MDSSASIQSTGLEIAIIGVAGRFPGARNVDEFWRNLRAGVESIRVITDDELRRSGISEDMLSNPNYVKAKGTLDDIELFDASFFGFGPREAEMTDPQQRIFLECAWHALEDAGYGVEKSDLRIGIYSGISTSSYFLMNLFLNPAATEAGGGNLSLMGNEKDFLATRTSYKLNLEGPSVTVQTACSTSLVATHLACQSLLGGECDMALAGGVTVKVPQQSGYIFQEGGINSPDGHCRAFDADAKGMVGGNGVGIVVLRRLEDAVADRDHIYAVIKGSAINNDGSMKVGFTAPREESQSRVVRAAHILSEIDPESISYVEAHGTGTELGDPIEIAALTQAFRQATDKRQYCAIGSVKTNIGHLDSAAGVAGLIKAALALHHKEIPASLHYRRANPKIDFESSPFYVNTRLQKWETNGIPRRAGVSSFGIGGTNAHVILEEAPERKESAPGKEWELLLVSARSEEGLEAASEKLAEAISGKEEMALRDVAYTLKVGRRGFDHRRAVVCRTLTEAQEGLRGIGGDREIRGEAASKQRRLVMMFSGQGEQRRGMFKSLYEREGVFRKEMERCGEIARDTSGIDLKEVLYGDGAEEEIERTEVGQVAIYAVEYALAKMWESRGLEADVVIGHSLGEYVAATIAGVMEVEQGVRLVSRRGELMSRVGEGAMTAVWMSEEEADEKVEKWVRRGEEINVAAVNGERLCVMSGGVKAIEELEREMSGERVMWKRLKVKQAYHSEMMRGVGEEMRELVELEGLREPKKELISSVTGKKVRGEVVRGKYWEEQTVRRVKFKESVEEAGRGAEVAMLEVGPGEVLSAIAREVLGRGSEVMASFGRGENEEEWVEKVIGKMWVRGVGVNWKRSYEGERRRRERLPGYTFEGKRYWLEREAPSRPAKQPELVQVARPRYSRPQLASAYAGPTNEFEKSLAEMWQQLFRIDQVGIHDSFFDLGGDSMLAVQFNAMLTSGFQVQFPLHEIVGLPTIAQLARRIAEDHGIKNSQASIQEPKQPSLLVEIQTGNSGAPLFLIHAVGGGVLSYRALAENLGDDLPVYGIQARGLDGPDKPFGRIEDMAAHYIDVLRGRQTEGPYYIGGHSFGGLVAFEIARQLRARNEEVAYLALLDSPTPGQMPKEPEDDAAILMSLIGNRASLSLDRLRQMSPDDQLLYAAEKMMDGDTLPSAIGIEQAQRILRIWKTNARAMLAYLLKSYDGRITYFRAVDRGGSTANPELPWTDVSAWGIEIHVVPGNHHSMILPPQVRTLGEKLRHSLDQVYHSAERRPEAMPSNSRVKEPISETAGTG